MNKFLIVVCSLSGCTGKMGEIIADYLKDHNHEVKMADSDDVTKADLEEYQYILIGTYTYSMSNMNEVHVPFELEDLLDAIEDSEPSKKYFGVFGSCDSSYNFYGEGIDLLADKLNQFGGSVLDNYLKVELYPDTEEEVKQCKLFAKEYLDGI